MKTLIALVILAILAGIGWMVFERLEAQRLEQRQDPERRPAPVEAAPVERGPIELRRTFSGTLEASAQFMVAPKVGGRIVRLLADFADRVERGQVVAELDHDEYEQAVAQADADLAVAQANLTEAHSGLEIASRELERTLTLRERGVVSESQYDLIKADELAKQAALQVAKARVTRAEAMLQTARIRLGYTRVTADWTGGDEQRIVAERHVDEGDTVAAHAPLLSIVELDPVKAVLFITEKDYPRLQNGHPVMLITDAFPGETFAGRIARIAPVFRQESRQARVELTIGNPDHRLKPGMFIRAIIVLERVEQATIVPVEALALRDGGTGVFRVSEDGRTVSWQFVETGIRQDGRVQLRDAITGRVVTSGQQLLDDGSAIIIPSSGDQDLQTETAP